MFRFDPSLTIHTIDTLLPTDYVNINLLREINLQHYVTVGDIISRYACIAYDNNLYLPITDDGEYIQYRPDNVERVTTYLFGPLYNDNLFSVVRYRVVNNKMVVSCTRRTTCLRL